MGDIYASAEQVLVWLGEPIESLSLSNALYEARYLMKERYYVRKPGSQQHGPSHRFVLSRCLLQQHARIAQAVRNTEPRWHTPVWVAQDVIRARRVTVVSGTSTTDLDDIRDMWSFNKEAGGMVDQLRNFKDLAQPNVSLVQTHAIRSTACLGYPLAKQLNP
jgi:hypothetical protein